MLVTVRYCRDKRATARRVSIRLAKDDSTYYIKPFQRSYAPPRGQIRLAKDWIVRLAVQFISRMPLDHSSLQSRVNLLELIQAANVFKRCEFWPLDLIWLKYPDWLRNTKRNNYSRSSKRDPQAFLDTSGLPSRPMTENSSHEIGRLLADWHFIIPANGGREDGNKAGCVNEN